MFKSMIHFLKDHYAKAKERQVLFHTWKNDFTTLNGRKPSLEEQNAWFKAVKEGVTPPVLEKAEGVATVVVERSHQQQDKRHFVKALAEWEDDLTILWAGDETIEFTYMKHSERQRRRIRLQEVSMDRNQYLIFRGYCYTREEQRTFKAKNIVTKIKHHGKKHDLEEWVEECLGLDLSSIGCLY